MAKEVFKLNTKAGGYIRVGPGGLEDYTVIAQKTEKGEEEEVIVLSSMEGSDRWLHSILSRLIHAESSFVERSAVLDLITGWGGHAYQLAQEVLKLPPAVNGVIPTDGTKTPANVQDLIDRWRLAELNSLRFGPLGDLLPISERRNFLGDTFEHAWKRMEDRGYLYGENALENVHLGWEMATRRGRPDERGAIGFERQWLLEGRQFGTVEKSQVKLGWDLFVHGGPEERVQTFTPEPPSSPSANELNLAAMVKQLAAKLDRLEAEVGRLSETPVLGGPYNGKF